MGRACRDRIGRNAVAPRVFVLAPHGRDAAVIGEVLAGLGIEASACGDVTSLTAALGERASAAVATEEDLAGPGLEALLGWVAGQPSWSDLPFLILGARTTRSAAQSALLETLSNAVLLERPLATEALATSVRAALRARGRQFQVRDEVAAREQTATLLRELNLELEHRVEARTADLRDSEARFRTYFESFPEALFVVNVTEAGAFAYEEFNSEAERVVGKRSAEVEGKPPEAFLPAPAGAVADREFRRCMALGRTHRYSQTLTRSDQILMLDVVVTPMRDAAGRIVRLLGVALDVTQERELEARLHQTQKLEALAQLTGGVAHDFNNLLQVVTSGLALLERTEDPMRRSKLVESMHHAASRGSDLVRRLLTFARRQALRPETVALGPWLDAHVRDLLSRVLDGTVIVRTRVAADLPAVHVDAAELELAMLNLAFNARDAMSGSGELLIEAGPAGPVAHANADGLNGAFVRLSVTDTGAGMAPETLARVFEPFFTTKPPGKGTGLGLAQVYGFARQSGGTAYASSGPGQGTTVSLLLPVADVAPAVAAVAPLPGRPLSILVCEDDDAVAALVCQLLGQLDHRARRVANAAEALAALAEDRAPDGPGVDLLLTDVIMPGGMDGAALAREATRRYPGLRVVLTTGYEGRADAQRLAVLRKPYRLDDLAAALAGTAT